MGILNKQLAKLDAHNQNPRQMTSEERLEFIRSNILALTDELHEALNETGWKPWATSKHIYRDEFIKELCDAQLFLHNLMLVIIDDETDIDSLEIQINGIIEDRIKRAILRQENGYDGVTDKCIYCKRSLDDTQVAYIKTIDSDAIKTCIRCGS